MQGLKINECGDQIVPIPIQRNNCIESVRLRKEILVNSAKMQESVQPLPTPATALLSSCKTSFLPMHSYQSPLDANYQIQSPFISKPPWSRFILLKLIRYDLGYRHWAQCWLAYVDWLRLAWIPNQGQLNFYWVSQFIVCLMAPQGKPKTNRFVNITFILNKL